MRASKYVVEAANYMRIGNQGRAPWTNQTCASSQVLDQSMVVQETKGQPELGRK